jgi:ketosteroid isomerase-like protein
VPTRAACPEELETLLEDACLLNDASALTGLFDHDAVLLIRATSQVRGRSAIANVIIGQLRHGGSYIAAPQLVLQSGRLALIISDAATSVARRGPDGWHYVISRLDL